jgi:hypothetical protein
MKERRRRSKNAGRICEKHRIILRTIDITKTQIGTKKGRTRNDEGSANGPPTKIKIKKKMKLNVKMKRKM